jgi:hypothetical protein
MLNVVLDVDSWSSATPPSAVLPLQRILSPSTLTHEHVEHVEHVAVVCQKGGSFFSLIGVELCRLVGGWRRHPN